MSAPKIVAAIVGWNDTDMLRGCVESVHALSFPVAYAEGPWSLAYDPSIRSASWSELASIICAGDIVLDDPGRPWSSEAAKRTALATLCESVTNGPDWLLWLDTDERLELGCGVTAIEARDWLKANIEDRHEWATFEIYQPAQRWEPNGYRIPRLIRAGGVVFRPPRDFECWRNGERIAYMDGEPMPLGAEDRCLSVPSSLLRIRHDRHERPEWQRERTQEYCHRRIKAHGV